MTMTGSETKEYVTFIYPSRLAEHEGVNKAQ